MPKRTNDFQALVYFLKRELAEGARVTESAEVGDADGKMREIDVLIEGELAGHPITIGIECRNHARKQPVGWVEEMWGKHQGLPTDRLVLVSRSGFTAPAQKKAARLNIEALSYEEATSEAAAKRVLHGEEISLVRRTPKVDSVSVVIEDEDAILREVEGLAAMAVYLEDGEDFGELGDVVGDLVKEPGFVDHLESRWRPEKEGDRFTASFGEPQPVIAGEARGPICLERAGSRARCRIVRVRVHLVLETTRSSVSMRYSRIGAEEVNWGTAEFGSGRALLVVPESRDALRRQAWLRTDYGDVRLEPVSSGDPVRHTGSQPVK